jgi:glutamate-1-semialdehyde 2,1-aminomutase
MVYCEATSAIGRDYCKIVDKNEPVARFYLLVHHINAECGWIERDGAIGKISFAMPESQPQRTIKQSEEAFARARTLMPGGVSSPVRAFKAVGGTPMFIKQAQGCEVTDLDNNVYIDYVGSYGPMIVGHAHERVVTALSKAIGRGTSYGAPTEYESELAAMIVSALPGMEMVRFVNSGTEATMSAIRLARGATKRDLIVKCIGCYHGHVDALLVQAGSGALTLGTPSSPGIPESTTRSTVSVAYNDLDAAKKLFAQYPKQIAAFLVEPVAGNMGVVPPNPGYLAGLRELCDKDGALLIFDEVMTGFRVAWGGAQVKYRIRPDITCLGKVIGGGLPVGAYAARRDLMEQISPAGPIYQAGTLSGNPLAMNAGITTLEILKEPGTYETLEERSARLETGLLEGASAANVPIAINRVGSMLTPFFVKSAGKKVTDFGDATNSDTDAFSRFFNAMLENGIYLPPSQYEAWFVGVAHTDEAIDKTIEAAQSAFKSVGA